MVPPKKREEKEPKKRTEDGQMGYLRTRSTRENAYDKKKREIKKWTTSLQLARWRLEYNPLWGKGVLAGPLHSALMWAPFDLLFIFFFIFWAEVPPPSQWRDFEKTSKYIGKHQCICREQCEGMRADLSTHGCTFCCDINKFKQIKWQTTLQENLIVKK